MEGFSDLRGYQARVLAGLLANRDAHPGETFTVMFPRQAGKNEVSSALVASLLLSHAVAGGSVVVCAPTLHPQATISFQRAVDRLRRHAPRHQQRFAVDGATVRCGEATATFLSGSPEANVAGHTASLLLIGDEAQDLDADWFNRQFRPMTASTGAATVLFGTPWQGDSLLETAVARNRDRDAAQPGAPYRNFFPWHHEVSWEEVGRYLEGYRRYVLQERDRLGPAHPIFLSQFELVAARGERRLFSAAQLWALEGAFGPLAAPVKGERYVAGLDFGGEGPNGDATVLTIGRMVDGATEVIAVEVWRGRPFAEVDAGVTAAARWWNFEALVCDATGLGAPLTASLSRALGSRVVPFVFGASSKSELGFELLAAASTGLLRIAPPLTPGLQALWDELRVCQSDLVVGGRMRWSAPAGFHDDCVASLGLCLRAATQAKPPRIAVGGTRA